MFSYKDMSSYVKKVHFKLHESYANPLRGKYACEAFGFIYIQSIFIHVYLKSKKPEPKYIILTCTSQNCGQQSKSQKQSYQKLNKKSLFRKKYSLSRLKQFSFNPSISTLNLIFFIFMASNKQAKIIARFLCI